MARREIYGKVTITEAEKALILRAFDLSYDNCQNLSAEAKARTGSSYLPAEVAFYDERLTPDASGQNKLQREKAAFDRLIKPGKLVGFTKDELKTLTSHVNLLLRSILKPIQDGEADPKDHLTEIRALQLLDDKLSKPFADDTSQDAEEDEEESEEDA